MSGPSDNKLIATALGAAAAGAALAFAAMKLSQREEKSHLKHTSQFRDPKPTYIYDDFQNDPGEDLALRRSGSEAILLPHNYEEKMRRRVAARVAVEDDNMTPRNSVTVQVPATSANMGPGCTYYFQLNNETPFYDFVLHACDKHYLTFGSRHFLSSSFIISTFPEFAVDDCIGMAVDLWTDVTVSRSDKFEFTVEGDGAEDMPKDETNYIVVGVKAAYKAANKEIPPLKYHCVSRIPYARGLGSSSAAIVAGIIAGLVLAGHRLPCWGSEALLQIAANIEVSLSLLFARIEFSSTIFDFVMGKQNNPMDTIEFCLLLL